MGRELGLEPARAGMGLLSVEPRREGLGEVLSEAGASESLARTDVAVEPPSRGAVTIEPRREGFGEAVSEVGGSAFSGWTGVVTGPSGHGTLVIASALANASLNASRTLMPQRLALGFGEALSEEGASELLARASGTSMTPQSTFVFVRSTGVSCSRVMLGEAATLSLAVSSTASPPTTASPPFPQPVVRLFRWTLWTHILDDLRGPRSESHDVASDPVVGDSQLSGLA